MGRSNMAKTRKRAKILGRVRPNRRPLVTTSGPALAGHDRKKRWCQMTHKKRFPSRSPTRRDSTPRAARGRRRCRRRSRIIPKKKKQPKVDGAAAKKMSSETARRVVSNPRRSIEDACLKPHHHPGKLALLDPGSGYINGFTMRDRDRLERACVKFACRTTGWFFGGR